MINVDFEYKGEKFFNNSNGYLEHIESKSTFRHENEAKKWVDRIIEENKSEGGL